MNYISRVLGMLILVFCFTATSVQAEEVLQKLPSIGEIKTGSTINASDFSKDGKYIAIGDTSGIISIWNAATLSKVTSWSAGVPFNGIEKILYSPDGEKIIVAGLYDVTISDIAKGEVEHIYDTHMTNVTDLAFNEDGSILYIVTIDRVLTFLDTRTGEPLFQLNLTSSPESITYNAKTNDVAVGLRGDGIKIYDGITGAYKKAIQLQPNVSTKFLSYSNDYSELFVGSGNVQPVIFDVDNGYQAVQLNAKDYIIDGDNWQEVGFSSSNDYVATVSNNRVMLFDRSTKKMVSSEYGVSNSTPIFSPDTQRLLVGGHLFDTSTLPSTILERVNIVRETANMSVGDLQTVRLSGIYSDGSQSLIPHADIKWITANPLVAKFAYGKLEALSSGVTEVKGEYQGMSASFTLTVENFKELDKKENVEEDKIWSVEFNKPVDIMTIKENNIYVTDAKGDIIPILYYVEKGNESIVQMIPVKDYVSKQTYTLWVKNITSASGTELKEYTKMDFIIR